MKKIILIIIITSISSICYSQYQYLGSGALTTKLLLHFNGNSLDASGNANNGTDSIIVYGLSYGKFNQGASFSSSGSKIKLTDNADMKPTGEFTFGCWIKTTSGGSSVNTIFQSWNQTAPRRGIRIYKNVTDNKIIFLINDSSATTYFCIADKVLNDGIWNNLVVTFNGSNRGRIYINGKLEKNVTNLVTPKYNTTNYVRIGCSNYTGVDTDFWDKQLDEAFLDFREWTSSEIKRFYTYQRGMYDNK